MGKKLLNWLYIVLSLGMITPFGADAATAYDSGYVSVGVPDLPEAVTFFQNVLDCRLLAPEAGVDDSTPVSVLLSCDQGSVIELFVVRTHAPAPTSNLTAQPLQFVSDHVLQAGKWLRQQGVVVGGAPHRLKSGPMAGRLALDFTAPWGLRLQLLDRDSQASDRGAVAAADAQHGGD